MDLTIFTVTFNAEDLIGKQIDTVVKAAEGLEFEHFIIDNGSKDKTTDLIKRNYPHIKLIENDHNTGFGAPHNQAGQLASGKVFLCLNPDMALEPGSLKKMVDWFKDRPEIGLASPLLLDQKGGVNLEAIPRKFPTVLNQLAVVLKIHHFFPKILNDYLYFGYDWLIEQEVDSVRGSFMLLKRAVYDKLGWIFDPRYFIWFEDVDLCREVKKMGLKVVHTPIISATDFVGQTFKKQNKIWKQKQFTASMIKYFKKWEPWYKWIWLWLARPLGLSMVLLFSLKDKKDYL